MKQRNNIFGKGKEENMNFFQLQGILIDFTFFQEITGVFITCYRFLYSEAKNKLLIPHVYLKKNSSLFH